MAQFKILSIDGGGIRGIIPSAILSYIEKCIYPRSISDVFDLITGTSTGGIITLGLSQPNQQGTNKFTANDMLNLYLDHGDEIFLKRERDFVSKLTSLVEKVGFFFQKPYESKYLEKLFSEYFGDVSIKDCLTDILITTYDIHTNRPFYFSKRMALNNPVENFKMKDVARATSAAPTFFQPSIVKYDNLTQSFIDGGVFANNPSILAYAEGKELWKRQHTLNFNPDVLPDDRDLPFLMLSLGTGKSKNSVSNNNGLNYRTKDWIEPLLSKIFMQSTALNNEYAIQHLLPPYSNGDLRYYRIDLELPIENMEMDNASANNLNVLKDATEKYISENESLLKYIAHLLN